MDYLFSIVDCRFYVRILLLMWHTVFITTYFIEVYIQVAVYKHSVHTL